MKLISSAWRLYRRFHGRAPIRATSLSLPVPDKGECLVCLGQAIAIVYKTNKLSGGGDGKWAEYEHEFETPCFLYAMPDGKKALYILGAKLKVTKAGIEN